MIQKKSILQILSAFAIGFYFLSAANIRADVRLPGLFSDNMVLQQGMKDSIWGWADDGEKITVTFRGEKVTTTAVGGKWIVQLKPQKAGGPDVLTVSGKNTIEFKNVLVGEVWVCSGQSNMEFALKNSFESTNDIATATNSQIHFFFVPKCRATQPTNDIPGSNWRECTPQNMAWFSAVAYYFARDLQKARGVPIGLIGSYWGGSPAEVWMRGSVLTANPRYREEILESYLVVEKKYEEAMTAFNAQKDAAKKGATVAKRPPTQPWRPSELYNGMIAPLIPYGIRGVIWYQGESNAERAEQYCSLFPDLIRNWRADWHEGDFPFLAVQLAPFKPVKDQPAESSWAELREAQLFTTKALPKVGMAVITDVGNPNDIHPKKKEPVGARLALAARGIAYGEKIVYSGPTFKSMKFGDNGKVILRFDNVGRGLEARGGPLTGFAICGEDRKFYWAKAEITGEGSHSRVVLSAPEVEDPQEVRFGWADCPVVNLWNREGLPASPFRTDDFPMITTPKQ